MVVFCWVRRSVGFWVLLPFVERAPVALDAGLELGKLTVGGALGSAGHLSTGGELCEGFGYPEGLGQIVPAFVEGGESLVRVAADELLADADLVKLDGPFGVAALDGQLGLLVALHCGFEVAKRVFFRPDPRPLFLFEPVEGRRLTRGLIPPAKDVPQTSENQAHPFRYARLSIQRFGEGSILPQTVHFSKPPGGARAACQRFRFGVRKRSD